jgi:hypothetical protein
MTDQYQWWMMLPHEQFQQLIDPTNQVCILLGAHWIALKQIMAIITEREYDRSKKPPPTPRDGQIDLGMMRWLSHLNRCVDMNHAAYNQWPVWVDTQLGHNRAFFGKTF